MYAHFATLDRCLGLSLMTKSRQKKTISLHHRFLKLFLQGSSLSEMETSSTTRLRAKRSTAAGAPSV